MIEFMTPTLFFLISLIIYAGFICVLTDIFSRTALHVIDRIEPAFGSFKSLLWVGAGLAYAFYGIFVVFSFFYGTTRIYEFLAGVPL